MGEQEDPKKFIRELHKSTMNGKEEETVAKCKKSPGLLDPLQPCNNDTVLHVAIQMGYECLAREILKNCMDRKDSLGKKNDRGDTILHEAATTNMRSLVEFLLNSAPQLLSEVNDEKESPLFKAAHYGQTEVFRFLADQQYGERKKILELLERSDQTTALHIAILAEFFDLALEIATQFPELREKEDGKKMTALQTLSSIPSAFKSCSDYGVLEKCIYYCIPSETPRDSLQGGKLPPNYDVCVQCFSGLMHMIIKGLRISSIPIIARLQTEKRRHESAVKLARFLIDDSLSRYIRDVDNPGKKGSTDSTAEASSSSQIEKDRTNKESILKRKIRPILKALFLATSNRIVEVVEEILTVLPEAVEHINDAGQNILHLAIKHRQLKIFDYVRKMELPTMLLDRQIDEDGYTILHQFGHPEASSGGSTHHGPVFQLRKEVQWFERVQKLVPPHYKMLRIKFHIKIYKEPTDQELKKLREFFQENYQKHYREPTVEELEEFSQTNHQNLHKELTAKELGDYQKLCKDPKAKFYKELTAEELKELFLGKLHNEAKELFQRSLQMLRKELTPNELEELLQGNSQKLYKELTTEELENYLKRCKELTPKELFQRSLQVLRKELTPKELEELLQGHSQKLYKEQTTELENCQKLCKELTAKELFQRSLRMLRKELTPKELMELLQENSQKLYKELTPEEPENCQKLCKELTAKELFQRSLQMLRKELTPNELEELLQGNSQKLYKELTTELENCQKLSKELTAKELFQRSVQMLRKELTPKELEELLQGKSQKLYKELTTEELENYQKLCKELTAKQLEEHFQRNRQKLYKELTVKDFKELLQGNNQKLYEELTAKELFQRKHQMLLEEAQKWLLQTSNSCSIVALLIATVAFVAAYNVSGGSDQATGLPILLHNQPFFVIFSMMNMLSFISSLTSLIMFLSITISPFQLQDFRHSLPKKLQLGFAFLFFSVAVTVLAFAATIALNVQLTEQLTTVLKYISAFLPVTFLAFLLSPLLVASLKAVKFTLKGIGKILINFFLPDCSDKTNTYPIYKAQ